MAILAVAEPPVDDATPRRPVPRRRGGPNGRALLGALLVTVAAVGAFALARSGMAPPTTRYAVAVRAVAPGERLGVDDLELRAVELPESLRRLAFTDPSRLVGAVTLGPLGADQLVQAPGVALDTDARTAIGARHEVTFPVARDRVPGVLRRGERVAVLATFGTGNDARTVVSVPDAVVLAFEADGDGIGARGTARLTLALPDAALVLDAVHATQVAEVSVVRATLADGAVLTGRGATSPTPARAATSAPPATLTGGGVR
jgi:hypothetical protein